MYGRKKRETSKYFHAVVVGYLYKDEGDIHVEILQQFDDDIKGTEIFLELEDWLIESIELGKKERYFFTVHIKAKFHTYYCYYNGFESEIEYELKELKSLDNFKELSFKDEGREKTMKTITVGCCQKEVSEEEFMINHGLCGECMDKGVEEANKRFQESEEN